MQHEQLLLDAIRDDPDDRESYAVYGDWLAQRGDPRGELIGLSLALERDPTDARLAKRVGQLAAAQAKQLPRGIGLAWKRGFVSELRLASTDGDLLDVLQHPLLQLVETVSLIHRDLQFGNRRRTDVYPGLVAGVVAHAPPSLRRLEIGDSSSPVFRTIGELQAVLERFPRLVELALHSSKLPAGLVEVLAPRMHAVELAGAGITDRLLRQLARVRWPQLRALALHLPWREVESQGASPLRSMMDHHATPKLVEFRFHEHDRAGGTTERVCADLMRSDLVHQLQVFDVTMRDFDIDIVRRLSWKLANCKQMFPGAEDETNVDALGSLAYYFEEPDTHRAVALCRKGLELAIGDFDRHNLNRRLGTALSLLGDLDGALAALDASLENESTCGVTMFHKAWTLKRLARLDEADEVLRRAETAELHPPARHDALYLRASIDAARGIPIDVVALQEACELLAEEIRARVVDADLHYELACSLALLGDGRQACDTLGLAIRRCPHYREWARTEIDFAKFRELKKFIALVESS